jgi:hypothetical protein
MLFRGINAVYSENHTEEELLNIKVAGSPIGLYIYHSALKGLTAGARHVKLCMLIDHKHTYKFCMKHVLCTNNYKHGGDYTKLWNVKLTITMHKLPLS